MLERNEVNCPVCDSPARDIWMVPRIIENDPAKLYGAASGLPGTQQLVRCRNCEMIYESPRYPEATILQGYMTSQEAGHDSQYPMRVRSFYRALVKNAARLPPPGAKLLDIGTAGGAFLDAAREYGYDAFGLEPSADLVARGKARGLQIEQGTIDRHAFAPASFDMVCLWDVIEHLCEPRAALVQIKALLKPNGVLLINFPDIGTMQAKLAGKRLWWILSVHLHQFTQRSIREICRRSGFEVFQFRRYWQTLEFGYLESMAVHYGIPLTELITRLTPEVIKRIPIPYYASQTTALARALP